MSKRAVPISSSVEDMVARIRLMRQIVSGESQQNFANKLGIDMKRWNNFERGYPIPREIGWLLCEKFPGMSVEWIWFGWVDNLKGDWPDRIANAGAALRTPRAAPKKKAKAKK